MAWKLLINLIILLLNLGCYVTEETIVRPDDDSKTSSLEISSCLIRAAELRDAIKCNTEKGDKGNFGFPGMAGKNGTQGPVGPQGPEGLKGEKGFAGSPGQKGEPGRGKKGITGEKGEIGKNGRGVKGDQGTGGPSGSAGLAGTCSEIIEVDSDEKRDDYGTADSPAYFLCHTIFDEKDKILTGEMWISTGNDKLKVRCQEDTKQTCLILTTQNKDDFQAKALNYGKEEKSFWLSDKTEYNFDLTKFFNNVTMKQIAWLQSKSTQVIQKIKYHCRNSYVAEYPETALRLLSWNDLTIGPYTTNFSPLSYSLPPESHACTEKAPKNEWRSTEIVITGSSNRLPVIDFQIRDMRKEDQRFYLELTELCFG